MKERTLFRIFLPALFAFILSGCGDDGGLWSPGKPLAKDNVKISILHITDPLSETSGYSYAHEMGIRAMRKELGLADDQIIHKVNIIDFEPADVENAIRDSIAQGANIIIATSWGYMDVCEKLSAEFPHVVFAHASGYKRNDTNFTNYFGRIYQARYLSGIAAGLKTRTNKIGYVAAMGKDNSEVTGGLNAFAMGVERVNPAAKIYVRITNSWFDPMSETAFAHALIVEGCDVIGQHCDTANPQLEAEKAGVWGIGYNSDMGIDAPKAVLTSVIWNWGVYYTYLVRGIIDGTFTTGPYLGGLAEGMVDITPLNRDLAGPGTGEAIEAERKRITREGFGIFERPLYTNAGAAVDGKDGPLPDSEILTGISWYYRNIVEP
ncbi:MAG: BMP family ABC transporter substrate-binding protein [Spirochaetales bacterium]|jgi:basic membrane protein A|nr:BMP family ABC transporter substrate-binding protein [Spirochaetales bacterium]